ncbi:MAG: hypothetical protein J5736_05105 [Bacilli bacterium]|nr:hypothetical protein [Bacilli bacterium]
MNKLEVGQIVLEYSGKEGVFVSSGGGNLTFTFLLPNPTKKEKAEFVSGNQVKFGIFPSGPIAFFLAKVGRLEWVDAPFSVWIEKELPDPDSFGNLCLFVLADSSVGRIEHIRAIGLSDAALDAIKEEFRRQLQKQITRPEYHQAVSDGYRFTTNQMVSRSVNYTVIEQQFPN